MLRRYSKRLLPKFLWTSNPSNYPTEIKSFSLFRNEPPPVTRIEIAGICIMISGHALTTSASCHPCEFADASNILRKEQSVQTLRANLRLNMLAADRRS